MSLDTQIEWFKAHERLVLLLVTLAVGAYGYNKYLDYRVSYDKTQATIANQQAQTAAQQFTASNQQTQLLVTQLAALQQQIVEQNRRIDQQMQQRAQQTQQQKKTDDQAAPAELAVRIQKLLGVGTIKVETSGSSLSDTLQYSLDAAHADADNLEDLQQARLDVKDLNTKLVSCQNVTDKQQDTITHQQQTIKKGEDALTTEKNAHEKDVTSLNQQKKKAWLNGFKWGAIAGFVGGLFVPKPHA